MSTRSETSPGLNEALFNERTKALGATTERERAVAAGISRASLDRYRKRGGVPSLPTLRRMAKKLGVAAYTDLLEGR